MAGAAPPGAGVSPRLLVLCPWRLPRSPTQPHGPAGQPCPARAAFSGESKQAAAPVVLSARRPHAWSSPDPGPRHARASVQPFAQHIPEGGKVGSFVSLNLLPSESRLLPLSLSGSLSTAHAVVPATGAAPSAAPVPVSARCLQPRAPSPQLGALLALLPGGRHRVLSRTRPFSVAAAPGLCLSHPVRGGRSRGAGGLPCCPPALAPALSQAEMSPSSVFSSPAIPFGVRGHSTVRGWDTRPPSPALAAGPRAVPCSEPPGFSCITAFISESFPGAADSRNSHQVPTAQCPQSASPALPRAGTAPSARDVLR